MKIYKILARTPNGELRSIIMSGRLCKVYKPGKIQSGYKGTPVFGFRTLREAVDFCPGEKEEIWLCEAWGVKSPKTRLYDTCNRPLSDVVDFWSGKFFPPQDLDPCYYIVCSKIKLLEKIS